MRKFFLSIVMFVVAAVTFTSCLGTNEYTYYDDTAITGFSIGTLNRYMHYTTSAGTDTVYKTTLSCSGYSFNIDHAKGEIWNSDSLPIGIDPTRVVCTVTTKNSGATGIKSITSDSLLSYSSTDSVNFSQPRVFYVYNTNGTGYRTYNVRVNVHQEQGDSCIWTKVTGSNSQIASLTSMKAVAKEDNIYVFGNAGNTPKVYTSNLTDGQSWAELATNVTLSTDAYKSVILKSGVFFCISDGKLLKSVDAANWHEISSTDLKQLVAATSYHLYALSADGKMMSSADDGATWVEEELDTDASLLPTEDISYAFHALQTNDATEKVVLIGNRSMTEYPNDETAVVWTKIDEQKVGTRIQPWNYVTQAIENLHKAPRAENWQIVSYDYPNIKAIRGNSLCSDTVKALGQIYQSGDEGITWLNDSVMKVPSDMAATGSSFAMTTDKANSVWIICGGTGQVWKVRINRLAWKEDQDYFDE